MGSAMLIERVCVGDGRGFTVYSLGKGTKCIAIYSLGGTYHVCPSAALYAIIRELKEREPRFRLVLIPELFERTAIDGVGEGISNYRDMVIDALSRYIEGCELLLEVTGLEECLPHVVAKSEELDFGIPILVEEPRSEVLRKLSTVVGNVAQLRVSGGMSVPRSSVLKAIEALRTILSSLAGSKGSERRVLRRASYVYSPYVGIFVPEVDVGADVVEGDVLGSIQDRKVKTPSEGTVLAISRARLVDVGDFVALIAK